MVVGRSAEDFGEEALSFGEVLSSGEEVEACISVGEG